MDNLLKYIKKMQNITYKNSPFNEIDAAIYALLPYLDIAKYLTKPMTIKNIYLKYQNIFESKVKDKFLKMNHELFIEMAKSKRFQDNILKNFVQTKNNTTQFGAVTIIVPHEFKYIAFEGTEDTVASWKENFELSYKYPIPAQIKALEYINKNIKWHDTLVFVGGHSKGGNLAISSILNVKWFKRLKVKYIFNFDGPGFFKNIINSSKYQKIENKIRSYYPEESIVGMIMENRGKKKIVTSTRHKIYAHNIHTWNLENIYFSYGHLSNFSKSIKHKMDLMLNNFDESQKELFVHAVFKLINENDQDLQNAIKELNIAKLKNMIKGAISLNNDEKKLILDVFKIIIKDN